MNRSFSKIRHIQESNMRLEQRMLSEQVTPTTTSAATPTMNITTTPAKSPMFGTPEQRAAAKAKRDTQAQKNEAAFVKAAQDAGMTREEYSDWLDKENKKPTLGQANLNDTGRKVRNNNPPPCKRGKCTGEN
jgi:hypothetical protein